MDLFHLDMGLFVWTLITFGLLMGLLARFAFRPLKRALDERERTIGAALSHAERLHAEAQRIQAEGEAQMRTAREAAQKVIDEGHRLATRIEQESSEKAREQAREIAEQARREIERETRKGIDDLKGTIANLSLRIAREVIRDGLDEARHRQIVDEFVERVKGGNEPPKP